MSTTTIESSQVTLSTSPNSQLHQHDFNKDTHLTPINENDSNWSSSSPSKTKPTLERMTTLPASFNTPPKSTEQILQRQPSVPSTSSTHHQMSTSPATHSFVHTPVSAMTAYLKGLLGFNPKTTKRTLSEEAECGSPESVSEWLRQGADPNEVDPYGYTPLMNACLRGCVKSVRVLINNGANVNMKASHGYSPLHVAAQNGHTEIVEMLLDHGADMETKNDDHDTPLMLAVRSSHVPVVDMLCQRGCDLHSHGFDDQAPIDYAINKHNLFMSDVLLKHERLHLNSLSSNSSSVGAPSSHEHILSSTGSNPGSASLSTKISNPTNPTSFNNSLIDNQTHHEVSSKLSLTTLLHEEQELHEQLHGQNSSSAAADSVFMSD